MFKPFSQLTLSALCILLLATPDQLRAGFGNDAFEDDPKLRQDDNLEWPEVEFPSPEVRGRGFKAGESFEYRAQWGWFRKAGRIAFSTETNDDPEHPALIVKTETASAGMIRKFYPMTLVATTFLDTENWRMLRNETKGKVRSDENSTVTLFDFERALMNYEDKIEPEFNHIRELPYDCPVDYSSAFLQLRGMDLAVGKTYPLFVSTKGKFYYAVLEVMELETLDTDIGEVECFRLEPISSFPVSKVFREGGKMAVWITNDERRIPVRFDVKTSVGNASIRLEEYELAE
ncbi:DUF3108 domain-containing protein [Pelagicoccus sp. NFK12]|uniref:DUF3108 domain-containing protein n=1 Tax=Pelagicoccus enzymogenes TaxID=2773457 RepID=A0A927IHY9_9BACT|nr:DUF3108 domain-containing protein [Pelagicoccus enzymogenes]MBD5780193.1 DUF3108 domain-containing protein [Pelagicoccus enzymogenes]MDQ8198544.1 DUF3108 domain-containing protein [Pelagicoccus enzymogenes]